MTLRTISAQNNMGTEEVYAVILKSAGSSLASPSTATVTPGEHEASPPSKAPSGLGRMALSAVCRTYNIDLNEALKKLAQKGIDARPEEKMRKISEKIDMLPADLYAVIR